MNARQRALGSAPGVALLSGLAILASCAAPTEVAREVRIGVVLPRTGDIETNVKSIESALELAVEAAEPRLVLGGEPHRLILIHGDSASHPETAVDVARELVTQREVHALIGLSLSRTAIPVAALADTMGVPMVSTTATHPDVTRGRHYAFRVAATHDRQGSAMARFARSRLGAARAAAVFEITDPYSRSLAEIFKSEFEAAGGTIVAFEGYPTGTEDFSPHLERVREGEAEVLYLPNNSSAAIRLQARQSAEMALELTLLGGDSWNEFRPADELELHGSYYSTDWVPEIDNPESRSFVAAYRERFGGLPTVAAALTYDALGLVCDAMRRSGELDPARVRDALAASTAYRGVSGSITFADSGNLQRPLVIVGFRRGERVLISAAGS